MKRIIISFALALIVFHSGAQTIVRDTLELSSAMARSVNEMIEGMVSGVGSDLSSRGTNSIRSDGKPLIIVDGVKLTESLKLNTDPFWQYSDKDYFTENDPLNFLAPGDIDKIEVLKDAGATSRYGIRGANGVILITTKRASTAKNDIRWTSNAGYENGVSHNHNLRIGGNTGKTRYEVGGNFRHKTGYNYGGLRANFQASSGKVFDFEFGTVLSAGNVSNPLNGEYVSAYEDKSMEYRGLLNASLGINFTPFLSWKNYAGADLRHNSRSVWYGKETEFGKAHGSAASRAANLFAGYNFESRLTFGYHFNVKHHVEASAAFLIDAYSKEYGTVNGDHAVSEELRSKSISYLNSHFYLREFKSNKRTLAANAILHYDFDKCFGLDGGFRADFSSAKRETNEPVLLPSASAYINLSRIFFRDAAAFSNLKLIGGWGVSALEELTPYEKLGYVQVYGYPAVSSDAECYFEGNTRLITKEWTAGVELGFIDNRITLSAKYYSRDTEDSFDLFQSGKEYNIDGNILWNSSDTKGIFHKESTISNRGVEIDFNASVIKSRNWQFRLFGTASYNLNEITSCEDKYLPGLSCGSSDWYTVCALNRSVGSLFYLTADAEGKPVDVTGEGLISDADRVFLGSTTPKVRASLGGELIWKRLGINALAYGEAGHKSIDIKTLKVSDASYIRLSRISAFWDIPTKKIGIRVIAGTNKPYYASKRSAYIGATIKF